MNCFFPYSFSPHFFLPTSNFEETKNHIGNWFFLNNSFPQNNLNQKWNKSCLSLQYNCYSNIPNIILHTRNYHCTSCYYAKVMKTMTNTLWIGKHLPCTNMTDIQNCLSNWGLYPSSYKIFQMNRCNYETCNDNWQIDKLPQVEV